MNEGSGTPTDEGPIGGLMTVGEVARQMRVSNMTVYRLVNSGQLPAYRVGRGYRIREADLKKYLQARYMDAG